MSSRSLTLLMTLALVFSTQVARAEPAVGIGLYLPDVPASAADRYRYVKQLAKHLTNIIGTPFVGLAYKDPTGLERAIKSGKIKFALVSGVFAAGRPYRRLAQARLRGAGDRTWSIMAKRKAALASFKGKTLLAPRLGPLTLRLLEHGVLGGEIEPKKYFKIIRGPDLAAALAAVKLGKADVIIAPVGTRGLRPVIAGLPLPPPALVAARKVNPKLVSGVGKALLSYGQALSVIHGWGPPKAGLYRAAAANSRKRTRRMAMVGVGMDWLPAKELVAVDLLRVKPRAQKDLFWVP